VLLTGSGRATFRALDSRSSREFRELLDEHTEAEQQRLVEALGDVRTILRDPAASRQVTLREPESGDHGWVLERHAVIYSAEHGWGARFEALCAKVVADFLASRDLKRERCWIAELDDVRCGSIYCTMRSATVAQIRLLLIEPWARGAGAGSALVEAGIDFARRTGYKQIMLWTNSRLTSARRIYESLGFELRSEEPSEVFSSGVGQEFWLAL
jgi:GNAT superfamily N-acetyltransferase